MFSSVNFSQQILSLSFSMIIPSLVLFWMHTAEPHVVITLKTARKFYFLETKTQFSMIILYK